MDALEQARACADRMYANDTASRALGIEIEIPEPGSAIATMTVRPDMTNGFDLCHGGLIFTLADTAFTRCGRSPLKNIAASAVASMPSRSLTSEVSSWHCSVAAQWRADSRCSMDKPIHNLLKNYDKCDTLRRPIVRTLDVYTRP
jgi:acyl-coenzyme A thioesterase PaaI-like protein